MGLDDPLESIAAYSNVGSGNDRIPNVVYHHELSLAEPICLTIIGPTNQAQGHKASYHSFLVSSLHKIGDARTETGTFLGGKPPQDIKVDLAVLISDDLGPGPPDILNGILKWQRLDCLRAHHFNISRLTR